MQLGVRIARLRKQHGMTQEQLADAIKTTRQAVSKWESGKSIPDVDYVVSMSHLFCVTTDYLLMGKNSDTTPYEPSENSTLGTNTTNISKTFFAILLVCGIFVFLLLPFLASIYRNYMFQTYGQAYLEIWPYLLAWPLVGVELVGILSVGIGLGGVRLKK